MSPDFARIPLPVVTYWRLPSQLLQERVAVLYIDDSPASFLRVRPLLSGYGAPVPPRARHVLAALPLDQCQKGCHRTAET
jgi:hypothetical protein